MQSNDEILSVSENEVDSSGTSKIDLAVLSEDDIVTKVGGAWIRQGGNTRSTELSKSLDFHLSDTVALLAKLDNANNDKVDHINNLLESKQAE